MKTIQPISIVLLVLLASSISSCAAVEGIFNAGMGVGIFIVIAIVLLIVFVIMKVGKNKS